MHTDVGKIGFAHLQEGHISVFLLCEVAVFQSLWNEGDEFVPVALQTGANVQLIVCREAMKTTIPYSLTLTKHKKAGFLIFCL